MKTSILIATCFVMTLLACNQESDYLTKEDLQLNKGIPENDDALDVGTTTSVPTKCIELVTTHWLDGDGKFVSVREKLDYDAVPNAIIAGIYVIKAKGGAMSDAFARGFSELSLVYDPRSHKVIGTLITTFYYGETLELKIDGVAEVRNDAKTMKITAKVIYAIFKTGREDLKLDNGVINFELPIKPEGRINMQADTKSLLCKS
jgi:hypothetical protein